MKSDDKIKYQKKKNLAKKKHHKQLRVIAYKDDSVYQYNSGM